MPARQRVSYGDDLVYRDANGCAAVRQVPVIPAVGHGAGGSDAAAGAVLHLPCHG